jgi:hypothetical protein
MQEFRIAIGFLCIHKQHKNMKYQAVHDRKSVHVVAFLGNNALICENDEKKQKMFLMTYCNTCRRNY